jgi:hypothetical protein
MIGTTKAVIAAIGTKLFLAKIIIAYAVTYSVTYIATGSAKAAQSAGLSAALFRKGNGNGNGNPISEIFHTKSIYERYTYFFSFQVSCVFFNSSFAII